MKALVVGAGRMGRAIAYDLLRQADVESLTLADRLERSVSSTVDWLERQLPGVRTRVRQAVLDARDEQAALSLATGHTVVVSASSYELNLGLTRAAIAARAGFVDLGGNNTVVDAQLALDRQVKDAGLVVVPDCGLAPGMVSLLAADGIGRLDATESVAIRVGGLPLEPRPPLDYQLVFSVRGLTNEYLEPAVVVRDGRICRVESLTELEELEFPPPLGRLEAFQTSGGCSTLPHTYEGKVKRLDYKTIRYPGHCVKIRTLLELGLLSATPVTVGAVTVPPRDVVEAVLERILPQEGPDVALVRVVVEGTVKGTRRSLTYEMIDRADPATGLSAMARATGFPAAVIAWMIGTGQVRERGALPQERCVPPGPFIEALTNRGLAVTVREA
ncbi:MAG: saccharopine dehydrogenase NADP-binding domain-containing protein [Candidatus Riflebacteria bacterium]|nr:saccharopine dehydrogenase NADP-binding domain-containing protein [Candidatus Riflebacteria bacterium]